MLGSRARDGRAILSDHDYCARLLVDAEVAVVPGACFGLSPYFRVSYAASESELAEAMHCIAASTMRLQRG